METGSFALHCKVGTLTVRLITRATRKHATPVRPIRQDPNSVHPSWATYFNGMSKGMPSEQAFQPPPNLLSVTADAPSFTTAGTSQLEDHMKVCRFALRRLACPSRLAIC